MNHAPNDVPIFYMKGLTGGFDIREDKMSKTAGASASATFPIGEDKLNWMTVRAMSRFEIRKCVEDILTLSPRLVSGTNRRPRLPLARTGNL